MIGRRGDTAERVCVAVDLQGYGRRTDAEQERAQEALATLLDAVWAAALPAGGMLRQANGDGEVTLLEPGIPATVVAGVLAELAAGLRAANRRAPPADRLRLRAAAHLGRARPARNGFAGGGVVRTCRLLASRALRAELAEQPGSDLAVALSEPLFAAAREALPAAEFRRVLVVEPAKAFRCWAWLHAGAPLPARAPGRLLARAADPEPQAGTMRIEIAEGGFVGSVVQARELRGGPGPAR